MANQQRGVSE